MVLQQINGSTALAFSLVGWPAPPNSARAEASAFSAAISLHFGKPMWLVFWVHGWGDSGSQQHTNTASTHALHSTKLNSSGTEATL